MLAIPALPELQPPPGVKSYKVVVCPSHTTAVPLIGTGSAFTVTLAVRLHPVTGKVYVTVATPAFMPVATPELGSIANVAVLLLVQVPPGGELVSPVISPLHTSIMPVISAGRAFTENGADTAQPVEVRM